MTIDALIQTEELDNCLLIGYFGGGNFGDELLLEVVMNMFAASSYENVAIRYANIERYAVYHHQFGYRLVEGNDLWASLKALLRQRTVVVGGGGLWGLDTNRNIFIMSILLFIARFMLHKRIYLIGVGFYGSASRLGRISAWFAAKSANIVICRDKESTLNFKKMKKDSYIDNDIAFNMPRLDLSGYRAEAAELAELLNIHQKTTYITLRKFRGTVGKRFESMIQALVIAHPEQLFLVSLLQPAIEYPEGDQLIKTLATTYPNVKYMDGDINPLVLYSYFSMHANVFRFMTPQFHAIIMAILSGIEFLPLSYDNKVTALLSDKVPGSKPIGLEELSLHDLEEFST